MLRVGLAVVVLSLVAPAAARAGTITFDDQAVGTTISNQYASQGVTFGQLPGSGGTGIQPKIEAPGAGVPSSGSQVGDLSNCLASGSDCEFYTPGTVGTFSTPHTTISVRAGLLGALAPTCAANSTDNTCSVTTLTAYNSAGNPVGTAASATLTQGAGVHTLLTVTTPSATIVGFKVSQRANSVDTGKDIAIDDLTFDTPTTTGPPDFSLSLAQPFVSMRQGQSLDDAITIGRFNGSNGGIDFAVTGLPTGVTATVAPSPALHDTATLTITVGPDAQPTGNSPPVITVTGTPATNSAGASPRDTTVTLQIKSAFDVRAVNGPTATLNPCQADIPIEVDRDFDLSGPVALSLTGGGNGITGALSETSVTFGTGAAHTVTLTATGDATGHAVGPTTFTVTGHVDGLPDRSATVTVSGTCPALYDARVTSMMLTQGTQTPTLPIRNATNKGLFRYSDVFGAYTMRNHATVVRVYANLASGPAGGVAGIPAVLYGYDGDNNDPLPGSPILPVSGTRTLYSGGDIPDVALEQASETNVYTFVLPDSWTDRNFMTLSTAVLGTQTADQGSLHLTPCTTTACDANDKMTLYDIGMGKVDTRTIRPVKMAATAGESFPDPGDVFTYAQLAEPTPLNIEPYHGTIDISDVAALPDVTDADDDHRNETAADRLDDYFCDHSRPDEGWVMGVNTGVARGLTQYGIWCYAPPRHDDVAVIEYKRPLTSVSHELGHLLGRQHASTACDATSSEDWPPDQQGFIQSVGLDLRQGGGHSGGPFALMAPPGGIQWFDNMGYCGDNSTVANILRDPWGQNHWQSVHNWNAIYNAWRSGRRSAPRAARQAGATVPSLRVSGFGQDATARITGVTPGPAEAQPASASPFHLLGLDAGGATVADVAMQESLQHVDGQAPPSGLSAVIPSAGVVAVAIARDGTILDKRSASAHAPTVSVAKPTFAHGKATLRWTAADQDGDKLITSIDYAANGTTFQNSYIGPATSSVTLPAGYLQRAKHARVRVTVNDGFLTGTATSAPFRSPGAKPTVRILTPLTGAKQPVDADLVATGQAWDDTGARLKGKRLTWRAGKRVLGHGESIATTRLAPGTRRVTLSARDRYGRVGRASIRLRLTSVAPTLLVAKVVKRTKRRVVLKVVSSLRARLTVRGHHVRVGRHARKVRVKVGRKATTLTLRVRAGGHTRLAHVRVKRA